MGRKTKLNSDITKIFTTAIEVGMCFKLACQYAGISESTFYAWMSRGQIESTGLYVEFMESIKRAESRHALVNLAIIQKKAKEENNWHAAAWLLERRHGYSLKQENKVEISVDNSELSITQLLHDIKVSNTEINELLKKPLIDLDE